MRYVLITLEELSSEETEDSSLEELIEAEDSDALELTSPAEDSLEAIALDSLEETAEEASEEIAELASEDFSWEETVDAEEDSVFEELLLADELFADEFEAEEASDEDETERDEPSDELGMDCSWASEQPQEAKTVEQSVNNSKEGMVFFMHKISFPGTFTKEMLKGRVTPRQGNLAMQAYNGEKKAALVFCPHKKLSQRE